MAQRSGGKLRLAVIDPQPFSEEEDRAAEFGLAAVPLGGGGESLYFGLAGTNSTDGREIIGFFQPEKEEFLEYDVASLVHRLGNPKRPVVGLMSGLPVDASFDPDDRAACARAGPASRSCARSSRSAPSPRTSPPIDDAIDVLMVIHPKDLSPQTQYAIDQFVMRGGKLIAFIDPQAENDPAGAHPDGPMPMPMAGRGSTARAAARCLGRRFRYRLGPRRPGLGLNVALRQGEPPSQHIAIIGLNRDSMNSDGRRHLGARHDQRDDRRRAQEEGRRGRRLRAAAAVEHQRGPAAGGASRLPARPADRCSTASSRAASGTRSRPASTAS